MKSNREFWYEDPNNGKVTIIDLNHINDLLRQDGVEVDIEDVDDATFYAYVGRLLGSEE